MLASEIKVPVIKLDSAAARPYVLQGRTADAWIALYSVVSLTAAVDKAVQLRAQDPLMDLRIEHHCGGVWFSDQLPHWVQSRSGQAPYDEVLWSGAGAPPAISSTVIIRINGIGAGVVTGYAVQDGWLGIMVQANEDTRPLWHRKSNPDNLPGLAFGAELKFD